ncbi:MAG: hypothetical protein ABL962_16380 [Fimbriimonadaceae bacterium]
MLCTLEDSWVPKQVEAIAIRDRTLLTSDLDRGVVIQGKDIERPEVVNELLKRMEVTNATRIHRALVADVLLKQQFKFTKVGNDGGV